MNVPLPGVTVDPQGVSMSVAITDSQGNTPTVYSDRFGVNTVALPDTITARTTFFLPGEGPWTITPTASGQVTKTTTLTLEDSQVATITVGSVFDASQWEQLGAYVQRQGGSSGTATAPLPFYNVKDYGAKGDGTTDDAASINAAITAAMPSAGRVVFPPGQYLIKSPIQIAPGTSTVPVPVPSLVGVAPVGRIGDATDTAACEIVLDPSFPAGHFAIQYLSPSNSVAPSGAEVANLAIKCGGYGAGLLIVQPRMFYVHDITIDHSADGSGSGSPVGTAATGAFTLWALTGTAPAYNRFEHITTSYAAKDGFAYNLLGNDIFLSCFDLNATRYAYNVQGYARWIACHYEQSQYGWYVQGGPGPIMIWGCDTFGVPTGNALQLTATSGGHPVYFTNCQFINNPGASPGEEAGSVIDVQTQSGNPPVNAVFTACEIGASTNTTDWVFTQTGATGQVKFVACNFSGTPATNQTKDNASILRLIDCHGYSGASIFDGQLQSTAAIIAGTLLQSSQSSSAGIIFQDRGSGANRQWYGNGKAIYNNGPGDLFAINDSGGLELHDSAGTLRSAMYSGSGAPASGLGSNGDFYFRQDTPGTANQRLYVMSAGSWVGIL